MDRKKEFCSKNCEDQYRQELIKELYQCPECGFWYKEKKWAEKCEAWCKEHKSCNLEITKHSKSSPSGESYRKVK